MILSINNKLIRLHGKEKQQGQVTETLTGISTVGNQYGWKVPIDAILNCKSNGLSITVDAYTTETGTGSWDSNTDFYCVKVNNSDEFVIFSGVNSFQAIDSEGHRGMTIPNSKWQDASLSNIVSWKNQGEEYVVLHSPSSDINRFIEPPTCVIDYYGEVEVDVKLGLANYFVPPPPEPGVLPSDMDFVYQAKDFDGTKIPNKAPNSTFGDYLQMGTLTVNGSGSTCYLTNGHNYENYLYKDLTEQEHTNIMANNSYYTFFVRMMNIEGDMGGIMSCRLEGGYIYMIRNNGTMLQFHTSQWEDMGNDFLINVDRVYKLVVGPNYYYGKNLDTGAEWSIDNYDERSMGYRMSTFNAASESALDRFYAFAGIARQTTEAEDLAIKDVLMNQNL